jgi:endonuclease/exonuclease/phosphatase family metal-dependent hydrolase
MKALIKHIGTIIAMMIVIVPMSISQILVDEEYSDWISDNLRYTDDLNDGQNNQIDFGRLWVDHCDTYLFISVELNKELIIQSDNNLRLYIDIDNDLSTGSNIRGIGADLIYRFSDRRGTAEIQNFNWTIFHDDIGLITSPTVSSDRFEIAIRRNNTINGRAFNMATDILVVMVDDRVNGDEIPSESGGIPYQFSQKPEYELPPYSITKKNQSDLRVLSYNVLRDGPWENQRDNSFSRILRAVNPDIIAFQEIYNHSSQQTKEFVSQSLGGNQNWYHSALFSDNILVSKYPILKTESIDGNTAFLVDVDGSEMLIISAHLPCCDNDFSRQQEVDNIMSFVRRSKAQETFIPLEDDTPIIICGDMNFVGENRQLETFLTGDIVNNNTYGPDFNPDWDGSDLIDAKPFATELPLTITWYSENESFSPGRLDYILYTGSVMKKTNSFVLFTASLSQDQLIDLDLNIGDATFASDHLPVVADFNFDLSSSVQLSNSQITDVRVYPNPSAGKIVVDFSLFKSEMVEIELLDAKGLKSKLLKSKKLNSGTYSIPLDLSQFQSGIYRIILSSTNESINLPVVIL